MQRRDGNGAARSKRTTLQLMTKEEIPGGTVKRGPPVADAEASGREGGLQCNGGLTIVQ